MLSKWRHLGRIFLKHHIISGTPPLKPQPHRPIIDILLDYKSHTPIINLIFRIHVRVRFQEGMVCRQVEVFRPVEAICFGLCYLRDFFGENEARIGSWT